VHNSCVCIETHVDTYNLLPDSDSESDSPETLVHCQLRCSLLPHVERPVVLSNAWSAPESFLRHLHLHVNLSSILPPIAAFRAPLSALFAMENCVTWTCVQPIPDRFSSVHVLEGTERVFGLAGLDQADGAD